MLKPGGREDGELVGDSSNAAAQDESLKLGDDGLPFVVVGVRETSEGEDLGQKPGGGRDAIVLEDGDLEDLGKHFFRLTRNALSYGRVPLLTGVRTSSEWFQCAAVNRRKRGSRFERILTQGVCRCCPAILLSLARDW